MKRLIRKLYAALCLLAGLLPLSLYMGFYLAPQARSAWFLAPGAAALLGALTVLIPGRLRIPWALLCALGLCLLFPPAMIPGILAMLGCMLAATPREPGDEWPQACWMGALGAGLFGQLLAYMLANGQAPGIDFLSRWLKADFALYVGLFVLHLNWSSVSDSVSRHNDQRPPRAVRSRNLLLSLGCVALLYLLSSWRALAGLLGRAWRGLAGLITAFFAWLSRLLRSDVDPGVGEAMEGGGGGALPPGEASPFWVVMEQIARVAVVLGLIALTVFLCYRLSKVLRRFFRWLRLKLRRAASALGENYQDRAESIFDWNEVKRAASQRLRNLRVFRPREPKWAELDARQRVRRAYAALRRAHPDVPDAMTARQALTDGALLPAREDGGPLADAYDAARYSDQEITPAQAEAMRKAARLGG